MSSAMTYAEVVSQVWKCWCSHNFSPNYTSVLTLHGMARHSRLCGDTAVLAQVREMLQPWILGEIKTCGGTFGYNVYRFGGNAAAWLWQQGELPEAAGTLCAAAGMLCHEHPRSEDGLFQKHLVPYNNYVWIDTVFGVCPFLLWVGKTSGQAEFVDEACRQMLGHHRRLFDAKLGIYHQAFNANNSGCLTPGHWGRGQGWAVFALAELADDVPPEHPDCQPLRALTQEVLAKVLPYQDDQGMWHQALEDFGSYPETSGTGLILYALGRGLANGSLDRGLFLPHYLRGLRALLRYVSLDGSVFNCCIGCLAPGYNGTVADYALHPWKLNDNHAFGPVLHAFGQAAELERKQMLPALADILRG
ncbi:MAG: glucuronyl hydrolase [Oligosphaeraceae bacterium]|nr:glucuronyl hydrolase [Oligosphaeraceae bacterium]